MTWLVESPWPAITLGVCVEAALLLALVRSGRGLFLVAMLVAGAATAGLLLLEWAVVTEQEEVEDALDALATALEANDPPRVLALFAADSPRRREVEYILSRVTINEAHVGGDLEIVPNRLTLPPSAIAYFTGRFQVRDNSGQIPYEHFLRKFRLTMHRDGDRWVLFNYEVAEPGGEWESGRISDR